MNMCKKPWTIRASERAFALPFAALVGVIMLVMGLAFLQISYLDVDSAAKNTHETQALGAAEIGIERARVMAGNQARPWSQMTYGGGPLVWESSADPLYEGHQICRLIINAPAGGATNAAYSVVIEDRAGDLSTSTWFRIHSFGVMKSKVRHVTLESLALTHASFGWLTNLERDEEGNRLYFFDGDVIDGYVYSNDAINIQGSPLFTDLVNTAASDIYYANGGPPADNPQFLGGVNTDAPYLDFQTLMTGGHIAIIRDKAMEPTGIYLGPNDGLPYRISFNPNATITIEKRVLKKGSKKKDAAYQWENICTNKPLSSTNGAIYAEEETWVSGVVNGQVTVATSEDNDILITDELVYAYPADKKKVFNEDWDPDDPNFTNKIGLISGGDIILKENDAADLYVMGSFVAVNGSFVNEYSLRDPAKALHIYGSMAQDRRGPVGFFGAEGATGYSKDYKYDDRFLEAPTPYYPPLAFAVRDWHLRVPEF